MAYGDDYLGLYSDYYRDPFPQSLEKHQGGKGSSKLPWVCLGLFCAAAMRVSLIVSRGPCTGFTESLLLRSSLRLVNGTSET